MNFKRQKSVRLYLHPMYSKRLVMMMHDFKIVNLELKTATHTNQTGAALSLLGSDGERLPWKTARYDAVEGAFPGFTLRTKDICGANVALTAFSSPDENPLTALRIDLENATHAPVRGQLRLFPMTADQDRYLTGLWDTGYQPYQPNLRALTMLDSQYGRKGDLLTDGYAAVRIVSSDGLIPVFTGKDAHNFRPDNCLSFDYSLNPGEKRSIRALFGLNDCDFSTDPDALEQRARAFWRNLLSRVTLRPDARSRRIQTIYDRMIVQCLQMLAKYQGEEDWIYPRQGCVGRFIWAWEAAYFLTALDRIGLHEYTRPAHRMLLERWQIADETSPEFGKIANPHVEWANTNGSVIWCVSKHLLAHHDEEFFRECLPCLQRAVRWIENKRTAAPQPGDAPRLFPSARASDWGEIGQHFTYTDSVNVMGYRALTQALRAYQSDWADEMEAVCLDYAGALQAVVRQLESGHDESEDYMPTHILGFTFEQMRTHCFYSDGVMYMPMCGNLDPNGRLMGFVERYYQRHGLMDHDLPGRITNMDYGETGLYGDVYYTNVPEICWFYVYLMRGDRKGAERMLQSIYRYNLTAEFTTSERYTPLDPWFAPWQPNASACGRIIDALLDYYGSRENQ